MTPRQIDLVQQSWANVAPVADGAAELFYGRLFTLDPGVKPLFRGDMKEQGRKLMTMITVAVRSLTRLDALVPVVQDLGRRHARYGVRDAHYDTVAAALLWTLGQALGDAFTDEVKDAWANAYGVLAGTMKAAAASVEDAAAVAR